MTEPQPVPETSGAVRVELARRVDAAAVAVPGVAELFAAKPRPRPRPGIRGDQPAPLSEVRGVSPRWRVEVCVGVSASVSPLECARAVAAAVRALAGEAAEVTVRIALVAE